MSEIAMKRALAEACSTIGTGRRSAVAELIMRTVEPDYLTLDVFSSFMPVLNLNPGDNIQYKIRKSKYPVRTFVPGTSHLTDKMTVQDKTAFMFDQIVAGTSANLWEIQSGDLGTVADMRNNIRRTLEEGIAERVFNLLTTVWNETDTPSNYTDASGTGVTRTVLDNMIENVLDRSPGIKAIFGTRRALNDIYGFAPYVSVTVGDAGNAIPTPNWNEYYTRNIVTVYKGIPIVEVRQKYDNALPDVNDHLLREDVVVVVGEDAGRIALMGGFETQDYTDYRVQPAEYVLHGWQQYALLVDMPDRIGVILRA